MVAGTAIPREQYNLLLAELLNKISQSEGNSGYRARLLIAGGILDDPAYVEVIEEQGGLVVTDFLCFGTRIMWVDVDERVSDPITALARYHILDRPSCPRMHGDHPQRADFIKRMVREFKVDGVVGERMAFCDDWGFEEHMFAQDLKDAAIPYLRLEREYPLSGVGQLKTRIQAFLETIKEV